MAEALTLVLNVGSSSLKAAVFATSGLQLWHGQRQLDEHGPEQLERALTRWLAPALTPWWEQIQRVGHRLVHGGERFTAPTRLGAAELEELEALHPLAPLHNPPALAAILWLQQQRPTLEQWACFDTAFHATLTPVAYSYALPAAWRQGGCRRYGFHGLSHQHLAEAAARHWQALGHSGQPRLISCHLGAGCSLTAIASGCSVDTSMGFTPLEGLVMASRSGSVDPGLLLHLQRHGLSLDALEQGLNHNSGLLGLSGLSGDWLELRTAAEQGHAGAQLALNVFRHRLLAGIGAMAASLGGVEMIGLTGGIGAADGSLLAELRQALSWLGPVLWLQIEADEERMIARLLARVAGAQAAQQFSDPAGRGSDAAGDSAADDQH